MIFFPDEFFLFFRERDAIALALINIAHLAFKSAAASRAFLFFMLAHAIVVFEIKENIFVADAMVLKTNRDGIMRLIVRCRLPAWKQKVG